MLMLGWLFGSALLFCAIVAAVFWWLQPRRVYRPLKPLCWADEAGGEEVWLRARDGVRLHGIWFEHPKPAGTVLFCHGNTSNVGRCLGIAAMYVRLGYAVLLFDYRGYGRSEGRPSEQGTCLDVTAAWEYLLGERGIAPGDIVVAGRSLGAAIAAWLAARNPPRALVLESAFTSLADLAVERYRWFPVRWLMRYRYSVVEQIALLRCPLLIIHSREDELVPFSHAERLYALAPDPKRLLEIAGPHRDVNRAENRRYVEGIASFLSRYRQGLSARPRRDICS